MRECPLNPLLATLLLPTQVLHTQGRYYKYISLCLLLIIKLKYV